LKLKRFIPKNGLIGHRKTEWTVLSDSEIVMRFNSVIRGFVNYYGPLVRDFSQLNKYIYLFNYSCAHTLANKHRLSIRKVFAKYGKPIKVPQKSASELEPEKVKIQSLLNSQECKMNLTKIVSEQNSPSSC